MYMLLYFDLMEVDILPAKENTKNKPRVRKPLGTDMKIFIAVCIVVALVLGAAVVYIVTPKDIAVVKNNKITNAEFRYFYSSAYQQLYTSYYLTGLLGQIGEETIAALAKQQALSNAAEVEYLLQEADREGFSVNKEDLDKAVSDFESSIKENAETLNVSLNTFVQQAYGIKYNQLLSIYKDLFKAQKYYEKLIGDMQTEEEELKAYYEENKDSFDYNAVRHILIKCDEDAEDSVVDEKRKLAESILERVNKGEDFAALAKEYSEDDGSKENGGLYDVRKGQMVEEFEEWTFSHNVGDTGLVRTMYGFHVMKLEGITNTFDALKEDVEEAFKIEKYQTALQEALTDGEYKVEIKDAYYDFAG